jgi:hypothetical protein
MLAFPVRHEVLMAVGFVVADGRDTASSFGFWRLAAARHCGITASSPPQAHRSAPGVPNQTPPIR